MKEQNHSIYSFFFVWLTRGYALFNGKFKVKIDLQHNDPERGFWQRSWELKARYESLDGRDSSIAHFGEEWWPGTQTRRARIHLWIYLGGRECKQSWRKVKWSVSAGFKQLKIVKQKVELKEGNMKMWSWRKHMCLGRFYLEKKQKNAPGNSFRDDFFAVEPKQPERKCSWISLAFGIQKNASPGESRHNSRWLLNLSPQTIP